MKTHSNVRAVLAILDILLIGIGLVIFSLFHHVIPREQKPLPQVTYNRPTITPKVTLPVSGTTNPSATPITDDTDTSGWYYDGFTDGDVIVTDTSYASKDVYISISTVEREGSTCYVQDIHIRSIDNLKTAFAEGKFGTGIRQDTQEIASANNAIAAINGDYYGARDWGIVVRNGTLYRDNNSLDVCVLYFDGTMATFAKSDINAANEMARGAYHAWSFGPALLDPNGQALTEFDSDIQGQNPRSAIGYYEPGHYCFVAVDGRQPSNSAGYTMRQLAQYMCELGCKVAYNLDGGQSSVMTFNNRTVNIPAAGGRRMSDIIYICELDNN